MDTNNESATINTRFYEWLISSRKLTKRSAGDVLSHLARASKLININALNLDGEDLAFILTKSIEFNKFSNSVKSHLRRSVRLYKKFLTLNSSFDEL